MTYAIVTVVVLILDQLMKFWTTKNIPLDAVGGDCVELLPNVLHLTNVHNYGAAFSILKNARWLLVAVTVVFAVVVIVLITQEIIRGDLGRWSAVLVMAGALSNGLDRALYGYVVDMFEFEFVNFAVFNIADIFITICGILFCVYILFEKPSPETNSTSETMKHASKCWPEMRRTASSAAGPTWMRSFASSGLPTTLSARASSSALLTSARSRIDSSQ